MRRWSSSLIITENAWSRLMTTPAPVFAPLNSRLIRWRSTRICFSRSVSSSTLMLRLRFIGAVAPAASRQIASTSSRWAGLAQPGKEFPARLRARRTRVISTIAVLLLAASVSSDGLSMSDEIVMGSTRRVLPDGVFGLVDFIAGAGGVFVALGLDGLGEVGLELGQPVVEGFSGERLLRDLAGVRRALVHRVQHGLDDRAEDVITRRAAKAAVLLEVVLGEPALLAAHPGRRRLGVERGLEQQVGEREAARVGHALGLRAFLAQVHLVHLVVHDLREVHGGGLGAKVAFERIGHGREIVTCRHYATVAHAGKRGCRLKPLRRSVPVADYLRTGCRAPGLPDFALRA